MRRLVVVAVAMVALLGGAYVVSGGLRGGNADVETVAVTRGPLESTIELAGTVVARESRTLAFAAAGSVATVEVAEGEAVAAGQLLATLEGGVQAVQLAAAEAQLGSANAAVASAQARLDADRDGDAPRAVILADRAQLAAARSQVRAAEAQVAAARQAMDQLELRSPIEGTVVALGLAAGDRVGAGASGGVGGSGAASGGTPTAPGSILIADLSELRVATTASEIDVVDLRDEQPVTLSFDALPDLALEAAICEIADAGRDTGGVVEFAVAICPAGVDARLRVGMSANVSIVLASVADALVVPSQAVRVVEGQATVRVLDADGAIRTVAVVVGIASGTRTQIVSGVLDGDRVVVGDGADEDG